MSPGNSVQIKQSTLPLITRRIKVTTNNVIQVSTSQSDGDEEPTTRPTDDPPGGVYKSPSNHESGRGIGIRICRADCERVG